MGKYFGTDGFRGEANNNLTADHAYKIGRFLGWYYGELKRRNGDDTPARIVIGKDTRRSSYMFEYTLVGGLVASGADAYSYAHELMEHKRDTLSHDLEFKKIDLKKNILPYDVHSRIIEICRQFKNVVSSITQINSEYVSCTLIYKYSYDGCEDKGWRWAAGRDPVNYLDLNKFVEKTDTSYYQIISDKTDFVYVPKKEKLSSDEVNKYHLGKRDGMYNNIGSAFSIKVAFGNNNSPLVEGILTVSTYGKHFTDNIDIEKADDVFKRMIIDEIFPYYKRLIELEFGMLYLRHVRRDVGE